MFSAFSYGSLMHPDDIEDTFGSEVSCNTCVLEGFKRHYGQRSEWRTNSNGENGGVMTVTPNHEDSVNDRQIHCNGVLITGINDDRYEEYKERELGYELVAVEESSFSAFEDDEQLDLNERVVVSIGAWRLGDWDPLRSYMNHCEIGAEYWGERFHEMFCETTYQTELSGKRPHI